MTAPFTYAEVGGTRDPDAMPSAGYHRQRRSTRLGGPDAFERGAAFVLGFGMQRGAGFEVESSLPVAREGLELQLVARWGPIRITAPAQVVYVLDEPRAVQDR